MQQEMQSLLQSSLQLPTHIYSQTGFPASTLFDSHPSLGVIAQETECTSLLAYANLRQM